MVDKRITVRVTVLFQHCVQNVNGFCGFLFSDPSLWCFSRDYNDRYGLFCEYVYIPNTFYGKNKKFWDKMDEIILK